MSPTASEPSSIVRGSVVLVELDPATGAEQGKTRPAVVVSNDGANSAAERVGYGVVTVVPLTRNIGRIRPHEARVSFDSGGRGRASKAQAAQVRSIAVSRIVRSLGRLDAETMAGVDDALRVHLSL